MKFIKQNSYDIVRLFINQMGITIFSLVLYISLGAIEDDATVSSLKIFMSVFAIGFYLALLYTAAWEYGAKDKIRIDGGRMEPMPAKGAVMAFCANLPNIALALVAIIFAVIYLSTGAEAFNTLFSLLTLIVRFIAAMYHGVLHAALSGFESDVVIFNLLQDVGYALAPLFAIGATQLGYALGLREKKIRDLFKSKR